jgi:hypothetical protein
VGDSEEQGVADLSCSASHSHAKGLLGKGLYRK